MQKFEGKVANLSEQSSQCIPADLLCHSDPILNYTIKFKSDCMSAINLNSTTT